MDIYEITGYQTGVSREGVNFLQPADAFQDILNGYIYRQVLQSRQGFGFFCARLAGESRIMGIFEHTKPDSTKELLAVDTKQLYKFNILSGAFDPVPFAGSLAAYTGFAIASKDFYISGVSYPTKTNTQRFVFTGEGIKANPGGSAIFFYDGTDVKDFTNLADNADYAAPTMGALTRANYVLWFNERLNFIVPVIANVSYTQGTLYSGIRNTAGNGDKFNVAGSGLLQADTYESITGSSILGQVIALNFDRSNWTLEKTTDAFNPYFIRKVPSVLGTNAKFSAVSWSDVVKSLGRTGVIATDGRKSLRVDNKIPYFTADEINQIDFNLIYGGFDRQNNQFLWAYKDSTTSLGTQTKVLVNNYEEETWSVYDQRFSVFGQTDVGLELKWDGIDETSGNESWAQWDTTEEIWDKIGIGKRTEKTLAGDDLGFIYDLNRDYNDYFANISAISQASQAVLTVSATGLMPGDRVVVLNVEGMTEINNFDPATDEFSGTYYTVVAATPTSITLNIDTTLFGAAIPNTGSIMSVIDFSAKTIPFNPYRAEGRLCYISHIEFLIDTNGGNLLIDIYADEEEAPFKSNVLLQPSTETTKAREWITMTVDNEANFMTIAMKQSSAWAQVRITSIRIHCSRGGYTSG